MKNKKPYSGKAISQTILLYATVIMLFFSAACKKNMESQADYLNADLNTAARVSSASSTSSPLVDNTGLNFFVTSGGGGVVESSFNYSGNAYTGYVTISGSALSATEYYSVSLQYGSNTHWWNVQAIKTGDITASINIGGVVYKLGTVYVYAISSGGASVTPMPGKVHLSTYYKTTNSAGDPGTLHLIFNWPAMPNSLFNTTRLFAALRWGPDVRLNTIINEFAFQEYSEFVGFGTMHMTWSIPSNMSSQYLQIAFTTDYADLREYFITQHSSTYRNQPSDPFLVTGLQSGAPTFHTDSRDCNVLKVINGVLQPY
jgi:hypothetical protein